MAEEKKRLTFLSSDEEGTDEQIENFKILLFQTNPMKRSLKVWFPLEEFSTYMRTSRFIDEVCKVMGEEFRAQLNYCVSEYGGMYMANRIKKEIKSLSTGKEQYDRSPKQILDSYVAEHPEVMAPSSFHEVNINNVFDVLSKTNPFK